MRCIVRDYVTAAIERTRPDLERFIAGHLECPEAVLLTFTDPVVSIREICEIRIMPRYRADYPPVDVVVALSVSLTARTRRRGVDVGTQTFALDVALRALGTPQGSGYDVTPQDARLTAWW